MRLQASAQKKTIRKSEREKWKPDPCFWLLLFVFWLFFPRVATFFVSCCFFVPRRFMLLCLILFGSGRADLYNAFVPPAHLLAF